MFFKQYYLGCLAHASYMVADEQSRIAAVIDPQRDIDQYLRDAEEHGLKIGYVILTHFHADFLAGHIELRNRAGARIVMGRRAEAEFQFQAVGEGDQIKLGAVLLHFLETPGHTPEGISIVIYDTIKSSETPYAVLTGDTLFIGDVGRPDLLASIGVTADELARMLFDSLGKLRQLPDSTLVYPAHGAGSMCGKKLSQETVSTIGDQKRTNYALQPMEFDPFRRLVTSDQPEAPDYFVYDAIKNRQDRPDLAMAIQTGLRPRSLDEVLQLTRDGAQLVDVREAVDFAGAHLVGAINIGLQGKYATWCGTVLSHDRPIVVIGDQEHEEEGVMRLGRIGFDNVVGVLDGGMSALANRPDLVRSVERITAQQLHDLRQQDATIYVLDVRAEQEWRSGHIDGSHNIPLPHLLERITELPAQGRIVVHCEGGYRSSIAASLLALEGRDDVMDMVGGIRAWKASDLPTIASEPAVSACGLQECR